MQTGISFAVGQLLAVVAPRTVLVVDAPTDWSLAGPLWELALDDAPVDEILDVLVRRGIRTAPSFAIVRVEKDAVRALVRGGVPVCFERAGEPVRLDASGATSWLEGLISGARRVLVGAVDENTEMPYLVSTGVVLVSGLALPTGVDEEDGGLRFEREPIVSEPVLDEGDDPDGPQGGGSNGFFGSPAPVPAGAGAAGGRSPHVVDLTRSGSRSSGSRPLAEQPLEPSGAHAQAADFHSDAPSRDWGVAPPRASDERDRPLGLNGHAPTGLVEPQVATDLEVVADPESRFGYPDQYPEQYPDQYPEQQPDRVPRLLSPPVPPVPADDTDLLTEGEPQGPSPADLPNFDPPSLSLPLPPAPPAPVARFDPPTPEPPLAPGPGVPAGWPPLIEPERINGGGAPSARQAEPEQEHASPSVAPAPWDEPMRPPAGRAQPSEEDDEPSLPFRVRGESLRPEQLRAPRGGEQPQRQFEPPLITPGENPEPPAPPAENQSGPSEPSGNLLLPAFFRGARAARNKPAPPSAREQEHQPDQNGAPNGGRPVPNARQDEQQGGNNWAPPMRRVFGDRGQNAQPDAPPGMPGVLRSPGAPAEEAFAPNGPGGHGAPNGAPNGAPSGPAGDETVIDPPSQEAPVAPEAPREPPRLLGVWCDAGHVTSPDREECRVCGLKVPPQAPILVARPPLGVLIFDNGDRVAIDRPVILGRDPKPVQSPDPESPVLHPVHSATGQVSRTHAEVRASGWDVVLTDLDAMNGTALTAPGANPVAIEPGVPTVLVSGARVDLGGETGFVFEIEG